MLNQHAAIGVPIAALGLCLVFALLTMTQNWVGSPETTNALTATMALVALWGGMTWLWLRIRPATADNAHPILMGFCLVMAVHHGIHLWVLGVPAFSINTALAALSCAYFMTARRWFLASMLVCLASWLPKAVVMGPFSPEWRYWTAVLGTGAILAIVAFEGKRLSLLRIESMRHLAEQRKGEAERALSKAESAVAESVAMEQVMHEAQRREALGKLAGGIAHDFNNLLAIIVGNIQLVREDIEQGGQSLDRLELIDEAANQAALLTRQILVYAGKAPARTTEVDLGQRITSTAALFRSTLSANTLLSVHGATGAVIVKADEALLDQVIVNLLQNAVDACEQGGGRIGVSWGYAGASLDRAYIEVADSGCGMDEATRQRAFDPFFTSKEQGTGLGLSVVKGIAESHGADIQLTSSSSGTTFRFLMPPGSPLPQVVQAEAVHGVAPPLASPVLVVDDDPGVRRIAEAFLKDAGYEVTTAQSGTEAITMLDEIGDISAALVDLTMPGMSGLDLAKALRKTRLGLPVVMMSGYDRDNVLDQSPLGQNLGFLAKPFKREQLTDALSQVVNQRG